MRTDDRIPPGSANLARTASPHRGRRGQEHVTTEMEEHFHHRGHGGRRGRPIAAVPLPGRPLRLCVLCGPVPVRGAGARLVCRHPAVIRSSVLIRTPMSVGLARAALAQASVGRPGLKNCRYSVRSQIKTPRACGSAASYVYPIGGASGSCRARRLWNSPSYGTAAGRNQNWRTPCQSSTTCLMELRGIEPLTSAVRLQRSPS